MRLVRLLLDAGANLGILDGKGKPTSVGAKGDQEGEHSRESVALVDKNSDATANEGYRSLLVSLELLY